MTGDWHKRGASFNREMTLPVEPFPDGYFAGWTVSSQARTLKGELVADMTCTWLDPVTTRQLVLSVADTSAWPLGPIAIDVRFEHAGEVLYTNTAELRVVDRVTRSTP